MNFLDKIEEIKNKIKNEGREDLVEEILELQISLGTGGEVLISVCSKLLELKRQENEIFKLIEKESTELISYAESIGLYPK